MPTKPQPAEAEVTYINIPLPTELHRQLRIQAIMRGDLSLKDAVIRAIEGWVAEK